jgi:hypothetical protein
MHLLADAAAVEANTSMQAMTVMAATSCMAAGNLSCLTLWLAAVE